METHPLMDIRFPEAKEGALLETMKSRATTPWRHRTHDPFNKPQRNGSYYFHRDQTSTEPPCTICIHREAPGHLVVHAIVPDAGAVPPIPIDQFVQILREFDALIATPGAESLEGMTSIGTSKHTLEDYFDAEAVRLLERFCDAGNGHGSHPSDQERWFAFLLHVHCRRNDVHCDTFGACLRAKGWWPDDGIPQLVNEFDFAMRLLRQSER